MEKKINLKWKRDYGDGVETDDTILWIDGKPTQNIVSQASGIYYTYINNKMVYMADSRKEAKEFILEELGLNK